MLTGTSITPVSPVAPLQTNPAPIPALRQAAPVSLLEDVIEKITPPLEFRVWMEKLKTYAEAARREEPVESASVSETPQVPATPPVDEAVAEPVRVSASSADDAAADRSPDVRSSPD